MFLILTLLRAAAVLLPCPELTESGRDPAGTVQREVDRAGTRPVRRETGDEPLNVKHSNATCDREIQERVSLDKRRGGGKGVTLLKI